MKRSLTNLEQKGENTFETGCAQLADLLVSGIWFGAKENDFVESDIQILHQMAKDLERDQCVGMKKRGG